MAMPRLPLRALIALLAVTGAFTCADASPQAGSRHRGGDARMHAERAISLDEAVARAERRYDARAVRAEEKRHGDRLEYRIRLLGKDGRVFEVRIDAASGREE
jgi:uncharacterized membrane protein YkoI